MRINVYIAAGLAVIVSLLACSPAKAEASIVGDVIGNIILGSVLHDGHSLKERQDDMLRQLNKSAMLLNSSMIDVMQVLDMDPDMIASRKLVYENLKKDSLNIDFIVQSVAMPVPASDISKAADAIIASGNQVRIRDVDAAMKEAKKKREMSDKARLLADKDAVFILKHVFDGSLSHDGGKDAASDVISIIQTAEKANKLIKQQDAQRKALDAALEKYENLEEIAGPSEEEAEREMEGWTPE